MKNLLLIVVVAIFLVGCQAAGPIQDREPIRVPAGLIDRDVESAILLAIGNFTGKESNLTSGQKIADNALQAAMGWHYESADSSGDEKYWYFEERMPGVVFAGFHKDGQYMRVAINFDSHQVKTTVVENQDLRQKYAYMYLQDFEGRLRRILGHIASEISYPDTQVERNKLPIKK